MATAMSGSEHKLHRDLLVSRLECIGRQVCNISGNTVCKGAGYPCAHVAVLGVLILTWGPWGRKRTTSGWIEKLLNTADLIIRTAKLLCAFAKSRNALFGTQDTLALLATVICVGCWGPASKKLLRRTFRLYMLYM